MNPHQPKVIFAWMTFSILTLLSPKGFPAGPGIDQNGPVAVTTGGVSPTEEMFSPAFQKCGKNYVETKMDSYPLGSDLDILEFWACKLKDGFFNPADLCSSPAGGGKTTKSVLNANDYKCSYEEKTSPPTAECVADFHVVDLQERTESRQGIAYSKFCSYKNGVLIECHLWPQTYEYKVYYSDFKCVRDGAKFPDQNYEGDQSACHPAGSWLGVTESDPPVQVCGYRRETNAPVLPPEGPPPPVHPLQ